MPGPIPGLLNEALLADATILVGWTGSAYVRVLVAADGSLVASLAATPTIDIGDVQIKASQGSFTSRSGTITAGGTSQQLVAANAAREKIVILNPATAAGQNVVAAESIYIRHGASAAGVDNGTSIEILPGGAWVSDPDFVSTEAIQVNAATTNHRWIALEA